MHIINTVSELNSWKYQGGLAFVPTMGALHMGHESLIKAAVNKAESVLVSVFVNPTQFGPNEDYSRYPRTAEADVEICRNAGAKAIFMPSVEDIYPEGFATNISVKGITEVLCGAYRPGHFDGVATVVARLLMLVHPDVAIFGEKDYQQLQVIKRMVTDLAIRTEIIGAPIFRESDGLAFSSRNAYLSEVERKAAPILYTELCVARKSINDGLDIRQALAVAKDNIIKAGFDSVDYFSLRDGENLAELNQVKEGARLLTAARIGKTRLIDNIPL